MLYLKKDLVDNNLRKVQPQLNGLMAKYNVNSMAAQL
jgi:hypothetical protein